MHWQDYILTAGSIIFSIALIPSLFSDHKPAISTSLSTGGVLIVYVFVYASLSLWFTTVSVAITGTMWLTLAVQRYLQAKRSTTKATLK